MANPESQFTPESPEALSYDWQIGPFELTLLVQDHARLALGQALAACLPQVVAATCQQLETLPKTVRPPAYQPERPLEVDVSLVDNVAIQQLNRDYRQKDAPTDVLSFPVWSATEEFGNAPPEVPMALGSIVVSLQWAENHGGDTALQYAAERVVHGLLHVMGQHHDTDADYVHVVAFQKNVLAAVF